MKHIFLIGFMGAGKSTIAGMIADILNLPVIETDEEIARNEQMTISDIFRYKGEHYFRLLESKFIQKLPESQHIISCGGGLPCFYDTILALKKMGRVIWIDTDIDLIIQRIQGDATRPVIKEKNEAEIRTFNEKRAIYYRMADFHHRADLNLDKLMQYLTA